MLKAEISTLVNNTKDKLESELRKVQLGLDDRSFLSALQMANLESTKDLIGQQLKELQSEKATKLKAEVEQLEIALTVVEETAGDFRRASSTHANYQKFLAPLVEEYAESQPSYRSVNAGTCQFSLIMSKLDEVQAKGKQVKDFGGQVFDGPRQLPSSPVECLMEGEH
ncbi:MAG: hypothetical protein R3B41_01155 [Candidatus Doudnabacteria bacterium]